MDTLDIYVVVRFGEHLPFKIKKKKKRIPSANFINLYLGEVLQRTCNKMRKIWTN